MNSTDYRLSQSTFRQHTSAIRKQVVVAIATLLSVCLLVMTLGFLQSYALNGVRAFTKGEGTWAKAQKDAIFYLQRYATYGHEHDYEMYRKALEVNMGDKQARLALLQDPPDRELAVQGFLQGLNDPEDVHTMINFFLHFENFYHVKKAIQIWSDADDAIQELKLLGLEIKAYKESSTGKLNRQQLLDIDRLNIELTAYENAFSNTLAEGARWVKNTTDQVSIITIAFSILFLIFYLRSILLHISQTEADLRLSEKRFNSLYHSGLFPIIEWNKDGVITDANEAFLKLFGYGRNELDDRLIEWRALVPEDQKPIVRKIAQSIDNANEQKLQTIQLYHRMGHRLSFYLGGLPYDANAEAGLFFALDQTQQQKTERQLRLAASVLDSSHDGILVLNKDLKILSANNTFCELMSASANRIIGSTFIPYHDQVKTEIKSAIRNSLSHQENWQGDTEIKTNDNKLLPVRLSISHVGKVDSNIVIILTDISDRKALEARLQQLAHHDPLTGLANRSLFESQLNQAISRADRQNKKVALLFIDLDRFKPINDEYGHEMGDKLLRIIAERLESRTREHDTVARIGGDEFVMIIEDVSDMQSIENITQQMVSLLSSPISIDDIAINIGCSIGISLYPDHGTSSIELTRSADIAMYAAKSQSDKRFYVFTHPPAF